jgi:hypothetical protein
MTIRHAIWTIGASPTPLPVSTLTNEQLLEDMIVARPEILSDEWMLIGRQENTGYGCRIDLLAVAPDGSLVLIELKRDRTPREVVAQAIDYASWVEKLRAEDIATIYARFRPNRRLEDDFRERFGQVLDEDTLNGSHQIIIVAGALDESSERIVAYLSERDIPINALCFQVFTNGTEQFLSRAWLLDPAQTQVNATATPIGEKEPWNGEFYASFGHGADRSWPEAQRYGFISAGGGTWYSNSLNLLNVGDRIWIKVPGRGFVGVGRVKGRRVPFAEFVVATPDGERPASEVLTEATYHRAYAGDPEKAEYFVPVEWLQTVPLESAVKEVGMFGNQNTVCKPKTPGWRATVDRLKQRFPGFDGDV